MLIILIKLLYTRTRNYSRWQNILIFVLWWLESGFDSLISIKWWLIKFLNGSTKIHSIRLVGYLKESFFFWITSFLRCLHWLQWHTKLNRRHRNDIKFEINQTVNKSANRQKRNYCMSHPTSNDAYYLWKYIYASICTIWAPM